MSIYFYDKEHKNFIGTQTEWNNLSKKEQMKYALITIINSYNSTNNHIKIKYSHCKSCGAPVNPYKEKCDYCGVYYREECG